VKRALAWLSCVLVATGASSAGADEKDVCASAAEESELLMRQGRLREARAELATCVRAVCPKIVQDDCKKWLEDVQAQQPGIVVRATDDAGQSLTPSRVLVDGSAVVLPPTGEPVAVDLGAHTIRVEATGLESAEVKVILQAGDRRHLVSIVLRRPAPAPDAAVSGPTEVEPAAEPPAAVPPSVEPETPAQGGESARLGPWIMGGAGVAAMGLGALFWIVGRGERSDLFDRCGTPGACTSDDIDSSKSSSQTKLVVGDVAFGLGLAAVAGAVLWKFVFTDHGGDEKTSFAPAPGGLRVRW
jgi:hypothetical protein